MNPGTHFERIVIGGGAMGLATTWQLASRGVSVLLLESFERGHTRGASHGATRNMNNAYVDAFYLDLYDEALEHWRNLEALSGLQLLDLVGLVTHGRSGAVRASYDVLSARGAATELITHEEATLRWPGMRFEGDVLVNKDAGRIYSANALAALEQLAEAHGADIRYQHRVIAIEPGDNGATVAVETSAGERVRFTADGVVVTAGAWSAQLLDGLIELPPLRVTEEHPAHFEILEPGTEASWPSFNHFRPAEQSVGFQGNVYGMLTPGEGVKVGFHAIGEEVDPDNRRFRSSDDERARLRDYVATWFPGLDPDSAVEISCTYTMTPSERFVLDRVGCLTVGAGFSGHGFKFVPAVGRVLADASLGIADPPAEFRLDSH